MNKLGRLITAQDRKDININALAPKYVICNRISEASIKLLNFAILL